MNLFATRTMLPMLEEVKPASSFLRDRFFGDVRTFDTKKVEIDIWQGKRRLAPYVHPKIGGKTVDKQGYRVDEFEPPEVSPDMITTAEDMLNRRPGETVYGTASPMERAAEQLGRDLAELDNMITRREEQQASEALFSGQVTVTGEGYDEVIKYWPSNAADQPYTDLTSTNYWDQSGSDPIGDIRSARRRAVQDSGVSSTDVILGADVADAMLNNSTFMKQMDTRRIDMGIIDPQALPEGVTYHGFLKGLGVDLFSYDEWYLDENGDEQPMVPVNKVLVGSPRVRTTRAYGVVALFKGNEQPPEMYAAPRVPDSWSQRKNPAGRIVQIKSKPLCIVHQIAGFQVIKALA